MRKSGMCRLAGAIAVPFLLVVVLSLSGYSDLEDLATLSTLTAFHSYFSPCSIDAAFLFGHG